MIVGSLEFSLLVLMAAIVFGPIVAEGLRVPGIVGLIAAGVIVGPFVLDWVDQDGIVADFGAIGILYLMFLAGLSFDIGSFLGNRRSALTYGVLGFVIPFVLSSGVVMSISEIDLLGAALIGAMWASNTLVAYPEVQAANLQGNRAVGAAVSAGVVADLMSLTVLALVTSTAAIDQSPTVDVPGSDLADLAPDADVVASNPDPTLPFIIGAPLLVAGCLWLLPRVAGWFFVNVGRQRSERFVFSLAAMSGGAVLAVLGGLEGLIGAFLAGLGMNRLVPTHGRLMERLDFVGGSLFVPSFLVSIGLSIDPALLVEVETIVVGLIFTSFVVVGKAISAVITGRLFGYSSDEVGLMSSLSFGQAASTLAIAQVGQELGMLGQTAVNGAVLAIVATAFITSYATRFFARRVPPPQLDVIPFGRRIMLDHRAGSAATPVVARLATRDEGVVVPFGVGTTNEIAGVRTSVDVIGSHLAAAGLDSDGVVRVDDSLAVGTRHLVAEQDASGVVLAWDGPQLVRDHLFGAEVERIGRQLDVPTIAAHVLGSWERVVVVCADTSAPWRREDDRLAFDVARSVRAGEHDLVVHLLAGWPDDEEPLVPAAEPGEKAVAEVVVGGSVRDVLDDLRPSDLVVLPAHVLGRARTLADQRINRAFETTSLLVVAGPRRLRFSKGDDRRPIMRTATGVGR